MFTSANMAPISLKKTFKSRRLPARCQRREAQRSGLDPKRVDLAKKPAAKVAAETSNMGLCGPWGRQSSTVPKRTMRLGFDANAPQSAEL